MRVQLYCILYDCVFQLLPHHIDYYAYSNDSVYSGTSLYSQYHCESVLTVRFPDFRDCNVHKQDVWDSQICLLEYYFQGVLISRFSDSTVIVVCKSTVYIIYTCSTPYVCVSGCA